MASDLDGIPHWKTMMTWRTRLCLILVSAAGLLSAVAVSQPPPGRGQGTVQGSEDSKPRLIAPRSGAEREAAVRKYGGSRASEEAVRNGVDWLVRHAEPGGGWRADGFPERCQGSVKCTGIGGGHHGEKVPHPYNDAITAFGCLALLGAGVLPDKDGGEPARTLDRALRTIEHPHSVWGTALGLEALAEAEVLEGKGRWKDAVLRLGRELLARRMSDGAFAYAGGFRGGSDVPYTALAVQGLVAARDAGLDLPADFGPGVDRFLDGLEEHLGRLAYLKEGRRYGYTPTRTNAHSGAAIRELLDAGTSGVRHKKHLACVGGDLPVWKLEWETIEGRKVQIGNLSLYQWYHGTIAAFHAGGSLWSSYFGAVKTALLGHQRKDGCARGSWNNEGTYERETGGRVLATALAVLMLEQPVRHRRR